MNIHTAETEGEKQGDSTQLRHDTEKEREYAIDSEDSGYTQRGRMREGVETVARGEWKRESLLTGTNAGFQAGSDAV